MGPPAVPARDRESKLSSRLMLLSSPAAPTVALLVPPRLARAELAPLPLSALRLAEAEGSLACSSSQICWNISL